MKKKTVYTFAVGDRVGEFTSEYQEDEYSDSKTVPLMYDPDNEPNFGKVLSVEGSKVEVTWDKEWRNDSIVEASTLAPEKVVKTLLSTLEKEFNAVEKQVRAKMKEVAKGIREANKLAKKTGRPLSQMHDVYYDTLYDAMDNAGWRTSSFGC